MKKRKLLKTVMNSLVCTTMAFTMFAMSACNVDDTPDSQNPDTGNTDTGNPQATKLSAPVISLNDNVISWAAVANADGYEVYEGTTVVSSQTALYYISDKNDGEEYTYTVKATSTSDSYTTSDASNSVTYKSSVAYTVTFMMDETVFDKQTVAKGETAKLIETDPAKPGYEFDKWVTEKNGSTAYDFGTQINTNTTVYASWTEKLYDSYKVTFETNGGSAVTEQDVTAGGKVNEPTAPTKDDCEFLGWFVDEELTEEFDFDTAINSAKVLYAKWAVAAGVNAVTESTTWSFNSGETNADNYYVFSGNIEANNEEVKDNKLTFNGYLRDNGGTWYEMASGTTISFTVSKGCTVKVTTYQSHTSYTINGKAADSTHTYTFNSAETVIYEATADNYIGKIEVIYPVDPITVNTTWSFKGDTSAEANYYVLASSVQGKSETFEGLTIDATGSGCKVALNASGYAQVNANTKISFKVAKDCVVTVNSYPGQYSYTLNGTAGAQDTQSFNVKKGTVEYVATNTAYIYSITVTFPEGSGDTSDVPAGYEKVETTCDFATLADIYGDGAKTSGKVTYGKFEFETGVYFEKSKNDINTQGKTFYFTVTAKDNMNTASFTMDPSASSSFTSMTIVGPDSNTVFTWSRTVDGATSKTVTLNDLPAGKYTVSTNASCRISNFKLTEVLEQGTPASMTLKPVTVDFLKNGTFNTVGLKAEVAYENSAVKSQDSLTIDSSSVDMTKEGEYIVRAFYTELGETVCATYSVNVYSVISLTYSTYTTNGATQTTLAQVYKVGGTFSLSGLTVNAVAKSGTKTAEFKLSANDYTYEAPDLSTVGEKTVTLTAKANSAITVDFKINVVDLAPVENDTVTVTVDPSKAVSSTNFKTINEALTYLANYTNVKKVVNIADGEYYEKVNINIPDVTLIGSATNSPNATTNNGVVIWYDAIAGMKDAGGATYGTNGSATVTVTSKATNFVAKNITFKNYFNTNALYKESLTISTDSQAVALLIESASASFYNCKLTGYHDTLYANKGNHYFDNCWIEGHTDFIFGQDARTYYNNCTIYSIGAGASEKNGGYIVALKPTSSTYYSVFNGCEFKSDENVMDGSIALGRAWGPEMKMVVINCDISGKYSTTAHSAGITSGQRYCTMSGNEPKAENMLEYNNTGAGSISSSIANTCTYMTETQAEAYQSDNILTILGFTPVEP